MGSREVKMLNASETSLQAGLSSKAKRDEANYRLIREIWSFLVVSTEQWNHKQLGISVGF